MSIKAIPGYESFEVASQRFRGDSSWDAFFKFIECDLKTAIPRLLRSGLIALTARLTETPNLTVEFAFKSLLNGMCVVTLGEKYQPESEIDGLPVHQWDQLGQIQSLLPRSNHGLPLELI